MKQGFLKSIILVVCFLVILVGFSIALDKKKDDQKKESNSNTNQNSDALAFKNAYEVLNNKDNGKGNIYLEISISDNNPMKSISIEDLLELLKSGTGIVYFGRPTCPWCRNAVPVLLEVAKEEKLDTIYYFDMDTIKNDWEFKDGKPVKTREEKDGYYELLELLKDYLRDYTIKDDDGNDVSVGEKRVYVPMVLSIKNGEVLKTQISTVDLDEGQTAYDRLTTKQQDELVEIYMEIIETLDDQSYCTSECD